MTGATGASRLAAVVLTGGAGRRMGGVDKPALPVGGRSMRERVLAAVADAEPRIVVGTTDGLPPRVHGIRERPAGGGPVAATAAGLALLVSRSTSGNRGPAVVEWAAAAEDTVDGGSTLGENTVGEGSLGEGAVDGGTVVGSMPATVALLAADLPLLTASAVHDLRTALEGAPTADGVVYVDDTGRPQWLCGVWRTASLRRALGRLATRHDGVLTGTSVRALMAELTVAELAWRGSGPPPWFDCDTDEDLRRAEEWIR
ncbi:NTP transferase domain-containing protein [Plantactinospora sp. B5E13]|uniref:molybdenum cofactor guanylyltransferase n=1 Tax=Plantactinospora sp. B5E13 TaxID=3153758 RepID=UPI00325E3EA2